MARARSRQTCSTVVPPRTLAETLLRQSGAESALAALLDAHEAATCVGDCPWQFAVEGQALLSRGASTSLLRLLVRTGLAEHRQETTQAADEVRKFLSLANLSLPDRCCLVLTTDGLPFICQALQRPLINDGTLPRNGRLSTPQKPQWLPLRRELRYGNHVIKAFRVPADNQERVLAAFEAAGWPECVDDPLPPVVDQDAKRRLHHTIQKLNQATRNDSLRFRGNGTGRRICWERRASDVNRNTDQVEDRSPPLSE